MTGQKRIGKDFQFPVRGPKQKEKKRSEGPGEGPGGVTMNRFSGESPLGDTRSRVNQGKSQMAGKGENPPGIVPAAC